MKPINSRGEIINEIPVVDPHRSTFDLSFGNTGTGQLGKLIPLVAKELNPADKIRINSATLLRFEPLAVPITGNMKMRHHAFAVPYRQVWNKWNTFITGGKGNTDNSTLPQISPYKFYDVIAKSLRSQSPIATEDINLVDVYPSLQDFANSMRHDVYGKALSNYSDVFDARYPHLVSNLRVLTRAVACVTEQLPATNPDGGENIKPALYWSSYEGSGVTSMSNSFGALVNSLMMAILLDDVIGNGSLWDYLGYPVWTSGKRGISESSSTMVQPFQTWSSANATLAPTLGGESSFSFADFRTFMQTNVDYGEQYKDSLNGNFFMDLNSPFMQDFGELVCQLWHAAWMFHLEVSSPEFYKFSAVLSAMHNYGLTPELNADYYYSANVAFGGLGLTADFSSSLEVVKYNVLFLRGFARIWYYFYRDQNLDNDQDPDQFVGDSVTDAEIMRYMILPPVCWRKDLFNTATLQAYQTNMVVPLSDSSDDAVEKSVVNVYNAEDGSNQSMYVPSSWLSSLNVGNGFNTDIQGYDFIAKGLSGLSLQNLKKCEMLAKWLDKRLYLGWTYADVLSSSWAVKYSDARLQLPEYLGGSAEDVAIQTLTNTTTTSEQLAGDQTAYAQGVNQLHCDDYFSEEHQMYFVFVSVVPNITYPHAVDKQFLRLSKFDYPWPEFDGLGQDLVTRGEVQTHLQDFDGDDGSEFNPLALFGYQSRYYDQKAAINVQHGMMNDSLRMYTFGRFNEKNAPTLNAGFVHCVPSIEAFVAAPDYQFIYDNYNKIYCSRCLSAFDRVL